MIKGGRMKNNTKDKGKGGYEKEIDKIGKLLAEAKKDKDWFVGYISAPSDAKLKKEIYKFTEGKDFISVIPLKYGTFVIYKKVRK